MANIKNSGFIPGIFLYCDRWCEKCAFTARCEAFSSPEKEITIENRLKNDEVNREFWQNLEKKLPAVEQWLKEKADKESISLIEFDPPKQQKNFDLFQRNAKSNSLLKAGRLYEDLVDDWFDEAVGKSILKVVETKQGAGYQLSDEDETGKSLNTNDLFAVILRYQLQVYLKLSRSYYSRGREVEEEKEGTDSVGAAKSTLELLDRSISAWGMVSEILPATKDQIFEILVLLQRLRYHLKREFPEVNLFKRPGFDL